MYTDITSNLFLKKHPIQHYANAMNIQHMAVIEFTEIAQSTT